MPVVLVASGKTTVATGTHYSSGLKKTENTTNRILYQSVNRTRAHLGLSNRGFPMMDDSLPEELALASSGTSGRNRPLRFWLIDRGATIASSATQ
jgi:hypothetical protein